MKSASNNHRLKSIHSSHFRTFIKNNSFYNLTGFLDADRAIFLADTPSVWIKASIRDITVGNRKKLSEKQANLLSTIYHEFVHCYTILGSSLGFIYYFSKEMQRLYCSNLINLIPDLNPNSYNFEFTYLVKNYLFHEELYRLFHHTRDSVYISQIKDYHRTLSYHYNLFSV